MSRLTRSYIAVTLLVATVASGCKPIAPFYLGEKDDLGHYLQVATDLEYPDVREASLAETVLAEAPLTLSDPQPRELWDVSLEDAIQISLHNSKVLKRLGGVRSSLTASLRGSSANVIPASTQMRDRVLSPDSVNTVFNPALQESNVAGPATQGVESALSAFDAQLNSSFFWDRTDRPLNATPIPGIFSGLSQRDEAVFQTELAKTTAAGTQLAFRNNTIYTEPNSTPNAALRHDWLTNFEVEARQPLLQGRGTQVNRIPVVLARIRTDISLADFECAVRDHVLDVESTYWETYFAYRALETAKTRRDSVHYIWRVVKSKGRAGVAGGTSQEEALARQEYYLAKGTVEAALIDLFQVENRLRFLMGLAPTDGRLIRPIDEPLNTTIAFDWHQILSEALCRSCELRIKRWQIKQREQELIAARNLLLPQMDAVALYRWLGRGEDLINDQNGPLFPAPDSDAFEQLFNGKFQEYRLGLEFTMPVGFRQQMAGVRNAQLQLARERAILQETELEVVHALTDRVQRADATFTLAETNFNRKVATQQEVKAYQALVEAQFGQGSSNLEFLLNAITRNADAQITFYRSLVDHTVAIADIHATKGSLLEYNNVLLAEGNWPGKAYYDAHHLARQRSAGKYVDYGYTRPRVISQGTYEQFQHGGPVGGEFDVHEGQVIEGGPIYEGPVRAGEAIETPLPTQSQVPTPAPLRANQANATAAPLTVAVPATSVVQQASAQEEVSTGGVEIRVRNGAKFDWGEMGGLQR